MITETFANLLTSVSSSTGVGVLANEDINSVQLTADCRRAYFNLDRKLKIHFVLITVTNLNVKGSVEGSF